MTIFEKYSFSESQATETALLLNLEYSETFYTMYHEEYIELTALKLRNCPFTT